MPQHLREAAHRRHREAVERATDALSRLSAAGKAINFTRVASEANVSTDFLYRQPQLRQRINELRTSYGQHTKPTVVANEQAPTTSAAVRALSSQLKELRRQHHKETSDLKEALAVAHGENLALRRKLACYE